MSALLGLVLLAGCASTGDSIRTQVFDDGSQTEYNAADYPVRYTDTSGKLFTVDSARTLVFDDGSQTEYNAAGYPVRYTNTSGKRFTVASSHVVALGR